MLKRLVNEVHFTLTITTTGPVLVKSGHATLSGPDMAPVQTFRNGEWQVYLPGSSLKGVLRSHLEKVCRTLNPEAVCDPFDTPRLNEPMSQQAFCGTKFQRRKNNEDEITSAIAYRDSCLACRLFGSTEFIGRISINDAYLSAWSGHNPTETRDGVGIDRLTGGAAHGAKFDLETVSSGVSFQTEIYLRNFEVWQLGMLMVAVQDMEDGLIRIGSGRSRGLGSVRGQVDKIAISYLGLTNGKPDHEVWGMGKFMGDTERAEYGVREDDLLTLPHPPKESYTGIRLRASFSGNALEDLKAKAIQFFASHVQTYQMPETMKPEHPNLRLRR